MAAVTFPFRTCSRAFIRSGCLNIQILVAAELRDDATRTCASVLDQLRARAFDWFPFCRLSSEEIAKKMSRKTIGTSRPTTTARRSLKNKRRSFEQGQERDHHESRRAPSGQGEKNRFKVRPFTSYMLDTYCRCRRTMQDAGGLGGEAMDFPPSELLHAIPRTRLLAHVNSGSGLNPSGIVQFDARIFVDGQPSDGGHAGVSISDDLSMVNNDNPVAKTPPASYSAWCRAGLCRAS